MNLSEIKNGCFYSAIYAPQPEDWCKQNLKKGRGPAIDGNALMLILAGAATIGDFANPLYGRVTVRKVFAGQAGTMERYERETLRLNPNYVPSKRPPVREATENPCVFRSLSNGAYQVMLFNCRTIKLEYFVDGRPATENELDIIKTFRKAHSERNPLSVPVKFPYVENIANINVDELPETIDED